MFLFLLRNCYFRRKMVKITMELGAKLSILSMEETFPVSIPKIITQQVQYRTVQLIIALYAIQTFVNIRKAIIRIYFSEFRRETIPYCVGEIVKRSSMIVRFKFITVDELVLPFPIRCEKIKILLSSSTLKNLTLTVQQNEILSVTVIFL